MRADMHVHTRYSDGLYLPEKLFAAAAETGLDMLVITDHDNYCGYAEAAAAAEKYSMKTTLGVEVSAYENGVKLHTLIYGADAENCDFKAFMRELYLGSLERCEIVIGQLKEAGIELTLDEVLAEKYCESAPVHSMHIAAAGAKKGYAADFAEFYLRYLAEGKVGFSTHARPTPERTAEIGAAAKGVVSLAHPGRIAMGAPELERLVEKLTCCGLSGIETYYTTHNNEQTAYFKEMASRLGLFMTGGSDTHRFDGAHKLGIPGFYPREELLAALKIR